MGIALSTDEWTNPKTKMRVGSAAPVRLRALSLTSGRLRFHVPGGIDGESGRIEVALRQLAGVRSARSDARTGNVLIRFDPQQTTGQDVLANASRILPQPKPAAGGAEEYRDKRAILRAGVRGVLGHALVDTVFYTITFAEPFGLALAPLGMLHLGLDILVWSAALAPLLPAGTEQPRRRAIR